MNPIRETSNYNAVLPSSTSNHSQGSSSSFCEKEIIMMFPTKQQSSSLPVLLHPQQHHQHQHSVALVEEQPSKKCVTVSPGQRQPPLSHCGSNNNKSPSTHSTTPTTLKHKISFSPSSFTTKLHKPLHLLDASSSSSSSFALLSPPLVVGSSSSTSSSCSTIITSSTLPRNNSSSSSMNSITSINKFRRNPSSFGNASGLFHSSPTTTTTTTTTTTNSNTTITPKTKKLSISLDQIVQRSNSKSVKNALSMIQQSYCQTNVSTCTSTTTTEDCIMMKDASDDSVIDNHPDNNNHPSLQSLPLPPIAELDFLLQLAQADAYYRVIMKKYKGIDIITNAKNTFETSYHYPDFITTCQLLLDILLQTSKNGSSRNVMMVTPK